MRREVEVDLPPPTARGRPVRSPSVQGIGLDGDRLVVRLDRPADGLRLRGPGHRRPGRADAATARSSSTPGATSTAARCRCPPRSTTSIAPAASGRGGLARAAAGRGRRRPSPAARAAGRRGAGRAPPRSARGPTTSWAPTARSGCARRTPSTSGRPTRDLWYFESFAGRSATDTPLAVFEELRRRVPELGPVWGILDHGHCGAAGVAAGRDRVSPSGTTCWARPGCWSPTPSSRSGTAGAPTSSSSSASTATRRRRWGESQWAARELPPRRVAVMRRRSVETWDLISTPTPEMTEVYREQYGYAGPAAEHGYPRERRAAGADADAVRAADAGGGSAYARTRRRCCTRRPGATTSRPGRARRAMSEHLDVDAAAAALGRLARAPAARAPLPHAGPVAPGRRRRDRPSGDQRAGPGLGRRRTRLLLAALRLRA